MKNITFKRLLNKVLKEDLETKAQEMKEKLYGKQSKLDKNKNGKLDTEDFKILRKSKKHEVEETDMYDETTFNPPGSSFDYVEEGDVCECGGEMREGECTECGMKQETIYEIEVSTDEMDEDSEMEDELYEDSEEETLYEVQLDEKWKGNVEVEKTGEYSDMSIEELNSAIKKQKDKNDKTKEAGKKVSHEDKTKMSQLYFAKRAKQGWKGKGKAKVSESVLFTENQLIDLIEEIVKKDKTNIKKGKQHPGYSTYEKVHKGSGKEEDDYMSSFMKKFKDYVKDGSKASFDTDPKYFPKGNGQLEKMKTMKYTMSDDGNEFLDDYMRPGMENLVPDEIEYDKKWVGDNIEGSSRTGNNPKWANAEETELGKKINKKMKDQKYRKAKLTAYRKAKQPITDGTGENSGSGLNIKVEGLVEKKQQVLNEEFDRMRNLMIYDRKTQ